jgi:hypothetical protein
MLEKNLEALRKTHPELAKKLESVEVGSNVTLFLGPNEDVNIARDDIALHNMEDPLGEALTVFETEVPEAARTYQGHMFIFGMGLGYLLRRTFINTEGHIFVFEPYLDVLRRTLEAVDFSQELSSKRLTIITDLTRVSPILGSYYLMGDTFVTFALPAYRAKEPELFLGILDEIKAAMHMNIMGQNTMLLMNEEFTRSSLENLPVFLQYPETTFLHDRFKGKPGVVVSAGPSLDRPGVLEALKANREHLIISSVGQALKALDNAGIQPDFVNVLEIKDVSQQLSGVSCLEDLNLVMLPQANPKIFALPTKRKMISHTGRDPLTTWLTRALGQSLFGYNHQGTVSITALIHLMKMGCSPIFLLGQDLAYPEGKLYAQNSVYKGYRFHMDENGNYQGIEMENIQDFYGVNGFYKDEADWRNRAVKFGSRLVETKGWDGEKIYTHTSYEAYRKAFEYISTRNTEFKLVNCSEGGAFITGFEHLPFAEALEKYEVKQYQGHAEFEAYLDEHYHQEEVGGESYRKVHSQFQDDRVDLEYLKTLAADGREKINQALEELDKKGVLTHSLESRIKKLTFIDKEMAHLTQTNALINCYIKREMMQFSRTYGRKLIQSDTDPEAGNTEDLRENLEETLKLYETVEKGVDGLIDTLDPIFGNFPLLEQPVQRATLTEATP